MDASPPIGKMCTIHYNCVSFQNKENNQKILQGLFTFNFSKQVGVGPRGPVSPFQNFLKIGGYTNSFSDRFKHV